MIGEISGSQLIYKTVKGPHSDPCGLNFFKNEDDVERFVVAVVAAKRASESGKNAQINTASTPARSTTVAQQLEWVKDRLKETDKSIKELIKNLNSAPDVMKPEIQKIITAQRSTKAISQQTEIELTQLLLLAATSKPKSKIEEINICAFAGCEKETVLDGTALKACKKCKEVFYCSKEHQVAHWKIHKSVCVKR